MMLFGGGAFQIGTLKRCPHLFDHAGWRAKQKNLQVDPGDSRSDNPADQRAGSCVKLLPDVCCFTF
jgi:hypothetical protein